ncbi:MAG TPA: hypothetical protein VFE58_08720, partial [Tepidisphaeraceae bacterium]|nr:hypothetical protein [Tepidisphaeraceae bacterium]
MTTSPLVNRIVLICAQLLVCGGVASGWEMGEPIVTYWGGPGFNAGVEDRTVEELRAGGWNMGWAKTASDLDVYQRHGMRGMIWIDTNNIDDAGQVKKLDEVIEKVKGHPAMYAYFLGDEPGTGAFGSLGKIVAYLKEKDPAHAAYINLLPTYATGPQLQVTDDAAAKAKAGYPTNFAGVGADDAMVLRYRDYLKEFVEVVKPDLISYDHYHFLKASDGGQYFLNLALVRSEALAAGRPFVNIIQACDSPAEGWRGPNENEIRWLTYTSLAYGAGGISHFRYDTGLWKDPGVAKEPLDLYWGVSAINREFVAIGRELAGMKSVGVYHCGVVPMGGVGLPRDGVFKVEGKEVLLGYFGKAG